MERTRRQPDLELEPSLDALPLFPLPQVVLLPGALMPLYVFEPRYCAMVKDALDGSMTLGIVQIVEPIADEAHPEIEEVAGVGTIVDATELPSGRYNIVLRGRARVRLVELPFVPPYRRARATVIPQRDAHVPHMTVAALVSTAHAFVGVVRARDKSFDFRVPADSSAGQIADLCAAHLLIDGRDRQRVLETGSVADRVRIVTEALALQQLSLSAQPSSLN